MEPIALTTYQKIDQGYMLIQNKHYKKAIDLFKEVLAVHPEDVEALVGLAYAYKYNKNLKEAVEICHKAIELEPENYKAFIVLTETYLINKRNYKKAEKYGKKVVELHPYYPYAHSLIAQVYYFKNDSKKSIHHAQKALELDPQDHIALMVMGLNFEKTDFEKAQSYYLQSLEISPNDPVVHCNYGLLNLELAKTKKGYELLREAVKLNPTDKHLQHTFKEAFIKNHHWYKPLYFFHFDRYIIFYLLILYACGRIIYELNIYNNETFNIFTGFTIGIIICSIIIGIISTIIAYAITCRILIGKQYDKAVKSGKLNDII